MGRKPREECYCEVVVGSTCPGSCGSMIPNRLTPLMGWRSSWDYRLTVPGSNPPRDGQAPHPQIAERGAVWSEQGPGDFDTPVGHKGAVAPYCLGACVPPGSSCGPVYSPYAVQTHLARRTPKGPSNTHTCLRGASTLSSAGPASPQPPSPNRLP